MSAISRYVLLVLFVPVNLVAFALMGVDKQRARTHQWRVPEKTLFLAALLFLDQTRIGEIILWRV